MWGEEYTSHLMKGSSDGQKGMVRSFGAPTASMEVLILAMSQRIPNDLFFFSY